VSNELVGKRAAILNENIVKWGSVNSIITSNRASDFMAFEGFFDVVLIDAPCSGEGMFRKDKGAIEQWSDALVMQCSAIQQEILDYAVHLVAPGGILVYSTCTFEPRENEQNIQRLYEKNPGMLSPVDWSPDLSWGLTPVEIKVRAGKQFGFYSYPHKVKGEGLFLSAMRVNSRNQPRALKGNKNILRTLTKEEQKIISDYAEYDASVQAVVYKEDVWLIPADYTDEIAFIAEKLSMRKAGIKAGMLIRNQFVPDHALAMSGFASKAIPRVELSKEEALNYMQRKNVRVPEEVPVGWIIFTYDGLDIGWAKNLGNRVNNHYPAEWRIRKEPRLNEVFVPEEDEVTDW
jgi:NOL1/NOP2/fmu family ribosome biogenesis protein